MNWPLDPRPPLSKKLFPVSRVGKKKPVGRSGFFCFFLISFSLTRMYKGESKKHFFEKMKKKVPVGPF